MRLDETFSKGPSPISRCWATKRFGVGRNVVARHKLFVNWPLCGHVCAIPAPRIGLSSRLPVSHHRPGCPTFQFRGFATGTGTEMRCTTPSATGLSVNKSERAVFLTGRNQSACFLPCNSVSSVVKTLPQLALRACSRDRSSSSSATRSSSVPNREVAIISE